MAISNAKKLLYLGFNRDYVNRTNSIILLALKAGHHVDFFGPGFQDEKSLNCGIEDWCDRNGPYDAIIFDHYVLMWQDVARRTNPFSGDVIYFAPSSFSKYAEIMLLFILNYTGKKIFIANCDTYGVKEKYTILLEKIGAYVIESSFASQTIEERADRFKINIREKGRDKGFWFGLGNDNWVNFIKHNRANIIQLPHVIGLQEFAFTPLEGRGFFLSVPGASYSERKDLYRLLTPTQRFDKLKKRVADRVYGLTHSALSYRRIFELHSRYDMEISNSKVVYVSGSLYRSPVRKYFEVPALGAMPVGQVVEGFEELGFIDGVNFVIAETYEDVKQVLASYQQDKAQLIAENARNLILRNHSEVARSKHLFTSIEKIVSGDFRGSYWSDGEYMHY